MHKHMRKKRQKRLKRKPVSVPKLFSHAQWGWIVASLVIVVGCFVLVAFAIGQQLVSSEDASLRSTASPVSSMPVVSGTNVPMLASGGDTQHAQQVTGVFSLSEGGPIPVPANVLHPTNIARLVVNNLITSIYAGAMARTPDIGAIAILQENITTGQQRLHLYQTAQPVGEVTILAIHNGILTLSTAMAHGTFNLSTDQFHFS